MFGANTIIVGKQRLNRFKVREFVQKKKLIDGEFQMTNIDEKTWLIVDINTSLGELFDVITKYSSELSKSKKSDYTDALYYSRAIGILQNDADTQ